MGEKYLIDSNCFIDFCNGKLPKAGRSLLFSIEQPIISVITHIEVLGFDNMDKKEEKLIQDFVDFASVLPLNMSVSMRTVEIRKKHRIKLPDTVIAATAITYNLTLLTRNESDFKNIDGLKLLNPWEV